MLWCMCWAGGVCRRAGCGVRMVSPSVFPSQHIASSVVRRRRTANNLWLAGGACLLPVSCIRYAWLLAAIGIYNDAFLRSPPSAPLVRTTLYVLTTFPIFYAICMRNHRVIIRNVVGYSQHWYLQPHFLLLHGGWLLAALVSTTMPSWRRCGATSLRQFHGTQTLKTAVVHRQRQRQRRRLQKGRVAVKPPTSVRRDHFQETRPALSHPIHPIQRTMVRLVLRLVLRLFGAAVAWSRARACAILLLHISPTSHCMVSWSVFVCLQAFMCSGLHLIK